MTLPRISVKCFDVLGNISFKEHLPEDGHIKWPKYVAGCADYNITNLLVCICTCWLVLILHSYFMPRKTLFFYLSWRNICLIGRPSEKRHGNLKSHARVREMKLSEYRRCIMYYIPSITNYRSVQWYYIYTFRSHYGYMFRP